MSTPTATVWQKQEFHTKAIVWFKSGPGQNGRTFNARELYFGKPVRDPYQYGIDGLVRMIEKFGSTVATAVIYDLATDAEIKKFVDGKGWL